MDLARDIVKAARAEQPRASIQVAVKGKGELIMHLSKNDKNRVVMSFPAAGRCWRHEITKTWKSKELRDLAIDAFVDRFIARHGLQDGQDSDESYVRVQLMYDNEEVLGVRCGWTLDYHVPSFKSEIRGLFDYYALSL